MRVLCFVVACGLSLGLASAQDELTGLYKGRGGVTVHFYEPSGWIEQPQHDQSELITPPNGGGAVNIDVVTAMGTPEQAEEKLHAGIKEPIPKPEKITVSGFSGLSYRAKATSDGGTHYTVHTELLDVGKGRLVIVRAFHGDSAPEELATTFDQILSTLVIDAP